MPQSLLVCATNSTHEAPSQQPEAQVLALQMHWPVDVLHAWPEAHAAQAPPPVPHSVLVCEATATHVPLLQQPVAHEAALQVHWPVEVSHVWPEAQAAQAAPPVPHPPLVSFASGTHEAPSQQPDAHEVALQTHSPVALSHVWPAAHATQAGPPLPHSLFVSLASGTHVEPFMHPVHLWLVSDCTSFTTTSLCRPSLCRTSAGGDPSVAGHPVQEP